MLVTVEGLPVALRKVRSSTFRFPPQELNELVRQLRREKTHILVALRRAPLVPSAS
ncbi:hypothetical protein KKC47_02050 [Patescibacteria group bacterium]|nr:hypothetical protein [Patescibacteria group bacterium]